MNTEAISPKQCMLLLAGFVIGTALLLVPTTMIQIARQDAWLTPILTVIPGLGLVAVLAALNSLYPGQSLVQYSVSILGLPGKLIGLLVVWFALHLSTLILRTVGEFVSMVMLFETPTPIVHLIVVLVTAFGLTLGIAAIARTFSILLLLNFLFILALELFTLPHADFGQLQPILSDGLVPVIQASLHLTAFPVGEILLFGMILFNLKSTQFRTTFLHMGAGLIMAAFVGIIIFERAITTLGVERTSKTLFAVVAIMGSVPGSRLFLPIFASSWFIFSLCQFFICYYAFVVGTAHWFKLSDHKPLIFPAGALIVALTLIIFNPVEKIKFSTVIWPLYALPIEFGIPLLLLIVALVRKVTK